MKFGSDLPPLRRVCRGALSAMLTVVAALCGAADGACAGEADRSLLPLLPEPREVRPWTPDARAQLAEGPELFALINGGAELFLRYGFERAAIQTYGHPGGRHIQVDIYMMGTAAGAAEVFARRAGATEPPLAIGDAGVRGEYYVVFRRGRFFVTVTSGDAQADAQAMVVRIARVVERRIPTSGP